MDSCVSNSAKKNTNAADLTVSLLQANPKAVNVAERLQHLENAVARAAKSDADVLVCPELFLSGYGSANRARELAEAGDGPFAKEVATIARQAEIAIAYGYPEFVDGTIYNSARVIEPDGNLLQNYRKCQLPIGFERECFESANQLGIFTFKGVKCSCIICYDVEFPEIVRNLAKNGVELILAPTALNTKWSIVAEKMIPTRALENGIYLAYSNYAGTADQHTFAGLSCLVGPNGQEIVRGGQEPGVFTGTIETSIEIENKRQIQYMNDLRNGVTLA